MDNLEKQASGVKKNISIVAVIIHYNQPDEAEAIYQKFVLDGFQEIILFDNGSDRTPPAASTTLAVEKNNFFGGGIRFVLAYIYEHYNFEYLFFTSTSVFYENSCNYFIKLIDCLTYACKAGVDVGIVQFTDDFAMMKYSRYGLDDSDAKYILSHFLDGTHMCLSSKLLDLLKKDSLAYFNPDLVRGRGMEAEAEYISLRERLAVLRIKDAHVNRNSVGPYLKNLRNESRSDYEISGNNEINASAMKKYGASVYKLAELEFLMWYSDSKFQKKIRGHSCICFPSNFDIESAKPKKIKISTRIKFSIYRIISLVTCMKIKKINQKADRYRERIDIANRFEEINR